VPCCFAVMVSTTSLFDPFTQVGHASESTGTGLGLAIVKQYAEAMGGRVEVSSHLGKGSRFSVIGGGFKYS